MSIITIPKKLENDDIFIVPRREYEQFLDYKLKTVKERELTTFQKRKIIEARKRIAAGKFYTINELKSKLGIKN